MTPKLYKLREYRSQEHWSQFQYLMRACEKNLEIRNFVLIFYLTGPGLQSANLKQQASLFNIKSAKITRILSIGVFKHVLGWDPLMKNLKVVDPFFRQWS